MSGVSVDDILSFTNIFSDMVMIIVFLDILALFLMLFLERCDPRVFVTWLILLIFLPPVGFILYLYLGATIYNRRKFTPKNITDTQLMEASEWQMGVLEKDAEAHPERDDVYAFARSMKNAGAWSYSNNNDITLYTEGDPLFRDMMADIRSAKKSVLIEYYIIRNDKDGNELLSLLTQKVREGVEVRLLTDAFGIGKGPKNGIFKFRNAGGHYAMFHSSINLMFSPKKNNRNHRKIAVIDGRIGYIGGFNIGVEYLGQGPMGNWRDSAVRIEGSAVIPLEVRFALDWRYASREDIVADTSYYPCDSCGGPGSIPVQIVNGGPDMQGRNGIAFQYLMMIEGAKESILLEGQCCIRGHPPAGAPPLLPPPSRPGCP